MVESRTSANTKDFCAHEFLSSGPFASSLRQFISGIKCLNGRFYRPKCLIDSTWESNENCVTLWTAMRHVLLFTTLGSGVHFYLKAYSGKSMLPLITEWFCLVVISVDQSTFTLMWLALYKITFAGLAKPHQTEWSLSAVGLCPRVGSISMQSIGRAGNRPFKYW